MKGDQIADPTHKLTRYAACSTAGGAGQGDTAEALSGLVRVFFYTGARALLVSHW